MSDHDALLQAAIAHPGDDTPRLVYADWLDENGQSERAEFIRVQVELARTVINDPATETRYSVLRRREIELLQKHGKKWAAEFLARVPKNRQTHVWFRRGMIGELWCTAKYFRDHADQIISIAPIEELFVRRPSHNSVAGVVGHPAFARIRALKLDADEVSARVVQHVLGGSIRHLMSLELSSHIVYSNPLAPPGWAERSADAVGHIAACRQLAGLTRLDLRSAGIGDSGARVLASSEVLPNLNVLLLTGNPLSDEAKRLLRDRFGTTVYFDYPDYRGRLTVSDLR